ncbi:MAG: winged helix-turn-helix domain-containing protein, partial [Aquabacterium commune]|uniref:winged helix-turn-helix domain-containing protein n=2 Tax=Aquabacterium TaxID=92793 RepID=UPI003BAFA46A
MPDSIRFDRFALRVQERVLYLDGQPTALGGRAMALLVVLVQRHGRLVTKAELMELVWPGLVVEENNLQVQVSALRKVLGTGAIVTVPGRGYRFVLPLLPREPGAASVLAAATLLPSAGASSSQASALQLPPVRRAQAEPVQAEALTALPAQAQRLWGRERDLAALDALLPAPLITLVGSAGIGKTALALAAA